MKLELFPTLQLQREFFAQPRGMERFWNYIATLTGDSGDVVTPIGSLNPMGREHNAAKVEALIAIDAEGAAREALAESVRRLAAAPESLAMRFSLVVVDDLRGMWSNRLTGELNKRLPPEKMDNWLRRGFIEIPCWVSETWTPEAIRREVMAMAYRLAYWQTRARPRTLGQVMRQEGLAQRFAGAALALPADDLDYSRDVIAPYREATETSILMAALFGDQAAREFGYEPLGLSPRAGLEVALADAAGLTPEDCGLLIVDC
jgi:hypothetical protein